MRVIESKLDNPKVFLSELSSTYGILFDKQRLMNGEGTANTINITVNGNILTSKDPSPAIDITPQDK